MMKQERIRHFLVGAERAEKHLTQLHFIRVDLTFDQSHVRILDVLLTRDHMTQKELSDLYHMDVITMSCSLDRLEESGYLVREEDPGHRRSYPICLTGEGTAETHKVHRVLEMMDDIIWKGSGQDEMKAFCGTMEKICENLKQCDLK